MKLSVPFQTLFLASFLLQACSQPADEDVPKTRVAIGLNPAERTENIQRNARTLAGMISKRAGIDVEIHVAQDYNGLVEAMRSRRIDFAFFAPVSYVLWDPLESTCRHASLSIL